MSTSNSVSNPPATKYILFGNAPNYLHTLQLLLSLSSSFLPVISNDGIIRIFTRIRFYGEITLEIFTAAHCLFVLNCLNEVAVDNGSGGNNNKCWLLWHWRKMENAWRKIIFPAKFRADDEQSSAYAADHTTIPTSAPTATVLPIIIYYYNEY